jgi:hypothetical protein
MMLVALNGVVYSRQSSVSINGRPHTGHAASTNNRSGHTMAAVSPNNTHGNGNGNGNGSHVVRGPSTPSVAFTSTPSSLLRARTVATPNHAPHGISDIAGHNLSSL